MSSSPQFDSISLDFLNYALASLFYLIKLTQPFWSSSHRFTALLMAKSLALSLLMLHSYAALEIVIKSAMLKRISRSMLLVNFNWHVWLTCAVYAASLLAAHASLWTLVKWGFRQADRQEKRFQNTVHAYLSNKK